MLQTTTHLLAASAAASLSSAFWVISLWFRSCCALLTRHPRSMRACSRAAFSAASFARRSAAISACFRLRWSCASRRLKH